MNRYFLYFVSLWGLFITMGCIANIYYGFINDKNKYIIYGWLIFGILGYGTHVYMNITRNNPDIKVAGSISKSGGLLHPSISLILCTIAQLLVMYIYLNTRGYFKIKYFSDIFVLLILLTIFARFIVWADNGFKYTDKLLFKNIYNKYV